MRGIALSVLAGFMLGIGAPILFSEALDLPLYGTAYDPEDAPVRHILVLAVEGDSAWTILSDRDTVDYRLDPFVLKFRTLAVSPTRAIPPGRPQ